MWFVLLCDVSVWNTQVSREAGAELSLHYMTSETASEGAASCPSGQDSEAVAKTEKGENNTLLRVGRA